MPRQHFNQTVNLQFRIVEMRTGAKSAFAQGDLDVIPLPSLTTVINQDIRVPKDWNLETVEGSGI